MYIRKIKIQMRVYGDLNCNGDLRMVIVEERRRETEFDEIFFNFFFFSREMIFVSFSFFKFLGSFDD